MRLLIHSTVTGAVRTRLTTPDRADAERLLQAGEAVWPAGRELTDEEWALLLGTRAAVVADELVDTGAPVAPLAVLRRAAQAQIDQDAERTRVQWITPGAGQAFSYEAKRREAEAMASDPTPDPANYPMLAAEIGITGATLVEVGQVVRANAGAWTQAAAAIEALRLSAKAAAAVATTPAAIEAAAQVTWPSP